MKYESYNINEGVSKHRSLIGWLIAGSIAIVTAIILWTAISVSAAPAATTVYDAVPNPLPSNSPSYGFEATQMDELGARVEFEGTARTFDKAEVIMSSWACETGEWQLGNCLTTPGSNFAHPVTLTIYSVAADGVSVGTPLKTVTNQVQVPYRPSADATCTDTKQWKDATGACFNGLNFTVNFDLGGVTLPDEVIYGISYNTHTSGYVPYTQAGDYDALNVSLAQNAQVETGTSEEVYWAYQNNAFQADGDWGYTPMVAFHTIAPKDACKNGGYLALNYKNQGQCVAGVQSSEKSKHNR